jgi:hypothetical protein
MPRCAFCDSHAKISGEHVWSNWIVELLEPLATGFDCRFRDTETGIVKNWQSATMHQKATVALISYEMGIRLTHQATTGCGSGEQRKQKETMKKVSSTASTAELIDRVLGLLRLQRSLMVLGFQANNAWRMPAQGQDSRQGPFAEKMRQSATRSTSLCVVEETGTRQARKPASRRP